MRVDVDRLDPDPLWTRHAVRPCAAVSVLARLGAPLPPVIVRRSPSSRYAIIGRHAVWEAIRRAGHDRIEVSADDGLDDDAAAAMLASELDANPIDEAVWLRWLVDRERRSGGDRGALARAARHVGLERSRVGHAVRLLELDPEVIEHVRRGRLSPGHARLLLRLESPDRQREIAAHVVHVGLSVAALDALLARPRRAPRAAATSAKDRSSTGTPAPDPDVARLERRYAGVLGSPVAIDAAACRIVIECGARDVLDGVIEHLERLVPSGT